MLWLLVGLSLHGTVMLIVAVFLCTRTPRPPSKLPAVQPIKDKITSSNTKPSDASQERLNNTQNSTEKAKTITQSGSRKKRTVVRDPKKNLIGETNNQTPVDGSKQVLPSIQKMTRSNRTQLSLDESKEAKRRKKSRVQSKKCKRTVATQASDSLEDRKKQNENRIKQQEKQLKKDEKSPLPGDAGGAKPQGEDDEDSDTLKSVKSIVNEASAEH